MEKRKGVSKLIVSILLLMILMIYIVTSIELYKAGEPERARQYYNQLINERCQATFDVASIEFGKDCSWVFQDIGYEIEYSARDCAARPLKLSIHSGGIEHACRRR